MKMNSHQYDIVQKRIAANQNAVVAYMNDIAAKRAIREKSIQLAMGLNQAVNQTLMAKADLETQVTSILAQAERLNDFLSADGGIENLKEESNIVKP